MKYLKELNSKILDFSDEYVNLPMAFHNEDPKWMIYAAGGGMGTYYERNTNNTNIEDFYKKGYNIFCSHHEDFHLSTNENSNDKLLRNPNIKYLMEHPKMNIVLCILTGDSKKDYTILKKLFKSSIQLIDTDDLRFYPPADVAYDILDENGLCINVPRKIIGEDDTWNKNIKFKKVDTSIYIKKSINGGKRRKNKTKKVKRGGERLWNMNDALKDRVRLNFRLSWLSVERKKRKHNIPDNIKKYKSMKTEQICHKIAVILEEYFDYMKPERERLNELKDNMELYIYVLLLRDVTLDDASYRIFEEWAKNEAFTPSMGKYVWDEI